eukprot:symbB.v1.2.042002.t1/scaffold9009.1/size4427/1
MGRCHRLLSTFWSNVWLRRPTANIDGLPKPLELTCGFALLPLPPVGLYLFVLTYVFDTSNDIFQAYLFFRDRSWFFGVATLLAIVFTLLIGLNWSTQGSSQFTPFLELQISLARGFPTRVCNTIQMLPGFMQDVYIGLLAPYGMLFATDMSALEALSASVTMVFAAAGWGDVLTGICCGHSVYANLAPCILKTLEPNRVRFMHLYFTLVGMLEFSGFAFASFILHPAVTLISRCDPRLLSRQGER